MAVRSLESYAREWKVDQKLFDGSDKELNALDREKIQCINKYPTALQCLMTDRKRRNDFFKWAIRDNNSVDLYVQYPKVAKRLRQCYLSNRIGRFATDILRVEKNDVTLLFEGKRVSILDESRQVTFKGGVTKTVGQVFQAFAKKNDKVGDFEMFSDGIRNWNSHVLGHWDATKRRYVPVNLEKENWWQDLPVFETVTKDQLEKRLGISVSADDFGVVAAKSTREAKQLDVDKSHGFLGVAIKNEEGTYNLYDMGKFAEKFPKGTFGYLKFLANTVKAKVEYPDSNNFYSHRQQALYARPLTAEKGKLLMQILSRELKKAREGNMVFQFGWENCAFWPQNILKELFGNDVPNLFEVCTLQVQATNPFLKKLVKCLNNRPGKWKKLMLRIVMLFLGSWRGVRVYEGKKKVTKSLRKSPFDTTGNMYNPGLMHRQIEEKKLQGKMVCGHSNHIC